MAAVIGIDAFPGRPGAIDPWVKRGERPANVVVIVDDVRSRHLLDSVWTIADDPRVRVILTSPTNVESGAAHRLFSAVDGEVMPWTLVRDRGFDLVIAGRAALADQVAGPSLILPTLMSGPLDRTTEVTWRTAEGTWPTRIVVAHDADLTMVHRTEAAERSPAVAGDSTHDRIVASLLLRAFYRRALGVGRSQSAIVVAAEWDSPLRTRRTLALIDRLLGELPPPRYRVMALGAPSDEWAAGELNRRVQRGLRRIRPEADWRAALVAADWVIGEPGPLTVYATVAGSPVLVPEGASCADSPCHPAVRKLTEVAGTLPEHGPVQAHLRQAASDHEPGRYRAVTARITSQPGRFHRNIRRLMCQAIGMRQPRSIPATDPVSPSFPID